MAENEDISHKDIYNQVKKNSDAITKLHDRFVHNSEKSERRHEADEAVREFVADFDAATRIGRGIRAFAGWLVFFGGVIALIWAAVVSAVKNG
jgi:hypothetical protein